jgi:hypothetical protein
MVEAVRIATEQNLPIEFVDAEIMPGHLIDRHCLPDPNFPDDEFALERGAAAHLALIANRLNHPPARLEPIDSWREAHMAERLRRLHPVFRRILFVCDATHVWPISDRLSRGSPSQDLDTARPPFHLRISQPSLQLVLRYLDDIPRLVESYEEHRHQKTAHEFRKRDALLEVLRQIQLHAHDTTFSLRHYEAFASLMASILEVRGRLAPNLADVAASAEGCFNRALTERIRCELLSYGSQVKGEYVREETDVLLRAIGHGTKVKVYVARECNPLAHEYTIAQRPTPTPSGGATDPPPRSFDSSWPVQDQFTGAMRRKTLELARQSDRGERVSRFRGALDGGIHTRTTLRSYLSPIPSLYVKEHRPFIGDPDRHAPIVWLFEDAGNDNSTSRFSYLWTGRQGQATHVIIWFVGGGQKVMVSESEVTIKCMTLAGCGKSGFGVDLLGDWG